MGVNFDGAPTAEFKKWYTKGICRFVGHAFRRPPNWKVRGMVDQNVLSWKERAEVSWENKYRMCQPVRESNYRGGAKYERMQPVLDESAWVMSGEMTTNHWLPHMSGSKVVRKDVAIAEAVKSTSPGYPDNLDTRSKSECIEQEEFDDKYDEYYDRLGTRDYVPCFWNLADKYELRSNEKIAAGKIRAFTASNIYHSIANAQLCHDMNQKFYRSAGKTVSFVGGTKYYGGWNRNVRRLLKHAFGFELDESDFDASIFARALYEQCEIRIGMLHPDHRTDENCQRMRNLYEDVVNSIMITPLGDVIVKNTGNPSGQGNTIIDNTMILYRLFCYAFIILWRRKYDGDFQRAVEIRRLLDSCSASYDHGLDEQELEAELTVIQGRKLSQRNMHKWIEMIMNGDDNTFSVSQEIIEWFNARSVAEIWTGIGVTTKSPCWDPRPVVELSFLSQSTTLHEKSGCYLPVPEHERIMDSLLYASESNDVRWSLLRAYALRLESWGCLKTRALLWRYIQYIWDTRRSELVGAVIVPKTGMKMDWEDVSNILMNDKELERLYVGYESASDPDLCSSEQFECIKKIVESTQNGNSSDYFEPSTDTLSQKQAILCY